MTSDVVLVLSTVPDDASAEAIARALVEEKLAACVSVLPPMISIYKWRGTVEREPERQLLMKTTRERTPALQKRLRELHPYELPEFIVVDTAGGNADYLAWIAGEISD